MRVIASLFFLVLGRFYNIQKNVGHSMEAFYQSSCRNSIKQLQADA